jgi:hypothetical protein
MLEMHTGQRRSRSAESGHIETRRRAARILRTTDPHTDGTNKDRGAAESHARDSAASDA